MSIPMVKLNEEHEAVITLDSAKEIDKKKLKTFLSVDNDAFLKCEFEKGKGFTLYYMYGDRVPLRKLLCAPMGRGQVLSFLRSLTWAFITARDNDLDPGRIMLGVNSLFWDREKENVSCVYLPVKPDMTVAKPLRIFLKELLVNIVYDDDDTMTYLGNIIRYINKHHDLDPESFLGFLNAQEKDEDAMNIPDISVPEETAPEAAPEADAWERETPEKDMALPEDGEKEDEAKDEAEDILAGLSLDKLEAQAEAEEDMRMPILEELPQSEAVGSLKEEMLSEDMVSGGTKKHVLPSENKPAKTAMLIRRSTQEQFPVDKEEIRIGKAPGMAEICIEDNPAVSRIHALIDEINGDHYITDNHSTNHTYVNGSLLPDGESRKLSDGDRIVLGNEELIFKLLDDPM